MASETIANGTSEIFHRLDLNEYGLRDVPREAIQEAKQEVADYLTNEILRDVNNGVSPVRGEGRFQRLDKDYSIREKGGNRLSNLEDEGDLLTDFRVSLDEGSFLEVGHKGGQTPKADGHNQLSGKAKAWAKSNGFPRRRYIPDDNQKFVSKITGEIKTIIEGFVPAVQTSSEDLTAAAIAANLILDPSSSVEAPDQTTVTFDNAFDDDVIDSLLEDALRRRRGGL